MGNGIEALMLNGMLAIFGNPLYIGLMVIIFFVGFVVLQNQPTSSKVGITAAAALLAAAFVPWLAIIVGIGVGFVLYLGLMRLLTR